jgi:glycerol-3-phosphate acyltransferase PlsX
MAGETRPVRIAVDAVGGDKAPGPILEGVAAGVAADPALTVVVVGPAEVVEPFAAAHERVEAYVTTEIIAMDEHPAAAVRAKKDSSIVVGARLVKDGFVDGFFSAGNTGAMTAAGTLVTGRIKGVSRPAIATVIPTSAGRFTIMIDSGANADVKPEYLLQFAHMGAAYAKAVFGVAEPSIGLLSIGEEPAKGNQLTVEAHKLIAAAGLAGFVGNVEGRDIPAGVVDVVVTDGFTGNVALKLMEGMAATIFGELRTAMTSGVVSSLAAAVLKPKLTALRSTLDPEAAGGAPLLGVDGVILIGHGSSGARAVASGLRVGAAAVRNGLVASIAAAVAVPSEKA